MSARSEKFEQLRDNWGNLPAARIQLFARQTARYSEAVIEEAILAVLSDCQYAPVVKDIQAACAAAERRIAARRPKANQRYRPGDPGPDGKPTFSPDQARAELRRLRATNPEWFGREMPITLAAPMNNEQRRDALELMISRIYVSGLRKCANLDGNSLIDATQAQLF